MSDKAKKCDECGEPLPNTEQKPAPCPCKHSAAWLLKERK